MAINLKFPPRRSPRGGFATNDTTIEAISDDLKILILTNYGERPIHYDYGANLRTVLFEQGSDVKQKIIDLIQAAVDKWMPFVSITRIVVTLGSEDSLLRPNEAHVDIDFSVGELEGRLTQKIPGIRS